MLGKDRVKLGLLAIPRSPALFSAMRLILRLALWTLLSVARAEGPLLYQQDFAKLEAGPVPEPEVFVVEGSFEIADKDSQKALRLPPLPLVDGGALFGPSVKAVAAVQAKFFASKTSRSFPRFGLGLHGVSGYRLLVSPAKKQIELVKEDQVIASAPFEWQGDAWCQIKFQITEEAGKWQARGWAWKDGEGPPEKPNLEHELPEAPGQGKASVWGAPYSEREIFFDDLKVFGPLTKAEAK